MPRPLLIRSDVFAYHVTVRSNNREWFYIPIRECWNILCESLAVAAVRGVAIPYSFVLMSNHFHLILATPNRNLDEVMQYFLSKATRWIQKRSNRINHIFGNRYKWTLLPSSTALAYAYKYVYRNPVKAGICPGVENYPFSTFNDLSRLPTSEGIDGYWSQIPRNEVERLRWLNKPTPKEQEALIGRALTRSKFAFTTTSNLQKDLRLLKQNYDCEWKKGSDSFWY